MLTRALDAGVPAAWATADEFYTTLAMLAHALLAVIAAHEHDQSSTTTQTLIPLTVNEIRHLFAKLITTTTNNITYWLHWSAWRRLHQARARTSHYTRRGHTNR
jgi:hypothetical protein